MLILCTPCIGLSANVSSRGGLWKAQVAFLDLRLADIPAAAGLVSTGPMACLSGQLQLIKGQLGMSSQVCFTRDANVQGCDCCLQAHTSGIATAATKAVPCRLFSGCLYT